jgi:hypothetical protein
MSPTIKEDEDLDLIFGAEGIGKFVRLKERQVYHHYEAGNFGDSVQKFGRTLVASKSKLRERFKVSA